MFCAYASEGDEGNVNRTQAPPGSSEGTGFPQPADSDPGSYTFRAQRNFSGLLSHSYCCLRMAAKMISPGIFHRALLTVTYVVGI